MRLPLLLSSTLLLPLSLAQVRITRPDTDKKLNLSAPTITIAWAVDNGAAEASQIVDIWFQTTSVGSSNLGYQLVANYTFNAAGTNSYDWNPRDEVAALKSSGVALPTEKASVFELRFHERNSSRGSTVRSESSDKVFV
ncbi:hypothetical protein QBC34DRAFT_498372 [Podospora aff. communis PSN243]|uniref:Uncharacterized protein n=1 Tax=Podospora aff. communis PSN243 TaxID=3040156 RepID=A0AAV9G7L5_9PEZI|nr:hypothetical protein QBC34DRAFT_498372 [Podospora aff. communis PSN243]